MFFPFFVLIFMRISSHFINARVDFSAVVISRFGFVAFLLVGAFGCSVWLGILLLLRCLAYRC